MESNGRTKSMETRFDGFEKMACAEIDSERLRTLSSSPRVEKFESLHAAARAGDLDEVSRLLAEGANPNERQADGRTPMLMALSGDLKTYGVVVRELLKFGADSEMVSGGKTPLQLAAIWNRPDAMEALTEAGADIGGWGFLGMSPLHCAVSVGAIDSMRKLLQLGADWKEMDSDADSPLHVAERSEFGLGFLEELRKAGIFPTKEDLADCPKLSEYAERMALRESLAISVNGAESSARLSKTKAKA